MRTLSIALATLLALTGGAPVRAQDSQALLDAHNGFRARHCVPAMTWSAELAASAQQWADGCSMNYAGGGSFGENLAWGTGLTAADAAQLWYDEAGAYDFNAPGFSGSTGHFTQVIWKGSTELGCGSASCNGETFWVCRYAPAGNWDGEYPQNVLPAC